MSVPGLIATIAGTRMRKKAGKALDRELANAPKYKITDEAFQNQALAQSAAFGRDRSIQMQGENINQASADAGMEARNATNSTSALLSTIAQINQSRVQGLRGLGQDEAALQNQKQNTLYGVNSAMIDERDKAWNYNQNMPFQMRVAKYRDQAKVGSEMEMAGVAAQAQTESSIISAVGSMAGGMMGGCDERLKENIEIYEPGLDAVMEMRSVRFDYSHKRYDDGRKHVGFIAQEIQEIVPEAVGLIKLEQEGEPNFLMVDFKQLVPVLVNAIQDLKKEIEALKKEVAFKANEPMEWVEPQ